MINTDAIIKLLLAVVLGGVIGFEREKGRKAAGFRTHILVCLGATLISLIALNNFYMESASRIIQGVITGIGFLGAGTILGQGTHVKGLTTAASIWIVAAIGISIGVGEYFIAVIATFIVALVLLFHDKTLITKTKK